MFGNVEDYAPLPSSMSAADFIDAPSASKVPTLLIHTAFRTGLIAGGIYLAGGKKKVWKEAVGGALMIEAFCLVWFFIQKNRKP